MKKEVLVTGVMKLALSVVVVLGLQFGVSAAKKDNEYKHLVHSDAKARSVLLDNSTVANGSNAYSENSGFTFNGTCQPPSNINSVLFRQNTSPVTFSAYISWSGPLNYEYTIRLSGGGIERNGITNSNFYNFENLSANTTYDIRLRVICKSKPSKWVNYSFRTPAVCSALENVNVVASANSVTATWDYPSGARFDYYLFGIVNSVLIAQGTTTDKSIVISGLTPNVLYSLRIVAFCNPTETTVFSDFTTSIVTTSCPDPSNLQADFTPRGTSPETFDVFVSWTGSARLQYEVNLTSDSLERNDLVTSPLIYYQSLPANTNYHLQVRILCNSVPGNWVTFDFTTPAVTACPVLENVNVVASANSVTATWDYSASGARFDYFLVALADSVLITKGTTTDKNIVINGLTSNVLYSLHIVAFCNPDDTTIFSDFTSTIQTTTCPDPTDIHAAFTSGGTSPETFDVSVSWTGSASLPYEVFLTGDGLVRHDFVTLPQISYEKLAANTNYNLQVRVSCNGVPGNWVLFDFTTPTVAGCPALENVIVTSTASSVSATWDYPSAASFDYYLFGVVNSEIVAQGTTTDKSIVINGLHSNVLYSLRLVALCNPNDPTIHSDFTSYIQTTSCPDPSAIHVDFTPRGTAPETFDAYVSWTGTARLTYEVILTSDSLERNDLVTLPLIYYQSLPASTNYHLQVRILCNGVPGNWVTFDFTTPTSSGAKIASTKTKEDEQAELNFDQEKIQLYPNPVKSIVNIQGKLDLGSELVIINQTGQVQLQSVASSDVNVSSLASGIYYLIVTQNGRRMALRFVKY